MAAAIPKVREWLFRLVRGVEVEVIEV
jgi:hypothetical protein